MILARWFHEGGAGMPLVALLALALIPVAVLYAGSLSEKLRVAALALLAATLAAGIGFTALGRTRTDAAVAGVDPQMRERILEEGHAEANRPIQFAVGVLVVAGIPILLGESRRRARRKR